MTIVTQRKTSDLHVAGFGSLPTPRELRDEIPVPEEALDSVLQSRQILHDIIFGDDPRHLVIVGPCSIHDTDSGLEYANRLAKLANEVKDNLFVVMRVYFEKPRTTVGWKGLIMDPQLDGTCDLPEGLRTARRFLRDVVQTGIPTATEFLDPITPQYIADLITWAAIGARTTESQTHRQMASGLSMPVGFKNTTSGALQPAVNAIKAASEPQTFLGVDPEGKACSVTTTGNPNCHVILRGGETGPNFTKDHVQKATATLQKHLLKQAIMVDCSHENCAKDTNRQMEVFQNIIGQVKEGHSSIIGTMLESNLLPGKQNFPQPLSQLTKGLSITDPCISWEQTESLLRQANEVLSRS